MILAEDLVTHPVVLSQGEPETKRQEIKQYFNRTFETYETLFEILVDDAVFYQQPCKLRHPLIFYFGHTATFFVNKLVLAKLLPERISPKLESIFAIGVDEMSWDDLNEENYDWPPVAEVKDYRRKVQTVVNQLIDDLPLSLPIDWQSAFWPIMMGIEHERIHLETSSVLIRQLPIELVKPHPLFPVCPIYGEAPQNQLARVPAGEVVIDHQDPAEFYGWDNEYGFHQAELAEFQAAKYLTSNQEYLEFVEAGGYQNPEFWSEEGRRWLDFTPQKTPTFWRQNNQAWLLRTLTDEIPMPWNWPVEVNFLEAEAFCNWKAQQTGQPVRLPSEDEYLRLRDHTHALAHQDQANLNLQQYASSVPVDRFQTGDFFDVVGNVWQWTQTPIYPFDGFKVHPLYDDFTTPTFDNRHNLFKGGCWISTGNEINGHSRYAFRRHFFQHAGFRYIVSEAQVQTEFSTYETDVELARACEFHYGEDEHFGVENFAQLTAELVWDAVQLDGDLATRADLKLLEVGCSVGRSCFELATNFSEVTGLDFSANIIRIAEQMKQTGKVRFILPLEGELVDFKEQTLEKLGLRHTAEKCTFLQQDPANLKPIFSGYDVILATNLLERLYDPAKFLKDLHLRLHAGGLLVLGSCYDWSEERTQKSAWLGGYKDPHTGEKVTSLEGIHACLDAHFERINEPFEVPFVVRHSQRQFQNGLSEFTLWKKKT